VIGMAYLQGKGVNTNIDEAIKWLRKASEGNDKTAQYTLGMFYGLFRQASG